MIRRLLFLLVVLVAGIPVAAIAQGYEARVLDKDDNQPVPYVNVGIQGTDAGTNSDEQGKFSLNIPEDAKDKMLSITLIGYEDYKIKVSDLPVSRVIYLKKHVQVLNEVVVRPAKLTSATLGNEVICNGADNAGISFPFLSEKKKKGKVVSVDTLTEIGTLMKVKHRKTFIDSVQINVGQCTYPEILFRLNVYEEIDGDFKNILREPIYIRLKKEQVGNAIKINLTDKNLVVDHNFIVSIEKVKELGPGNFTLCGKMFGAAMYMRIASVNDIFLKLPIIGMGIMSYVTFSENK